MIPTVEKFPRSQKFLLGDRLQGLALDLVERLIEATYTRDRRPPLRAANVILQKMRLMLRLAFDLHHLDARRLEYAAKTVDEIGRLIGGWLKADAAAGLNGSAPPHGA